jgi:putative sporulation protein YyaC
MKPAVRRETPLKVAHADANACALLTERLTHYMTTMAENRRIAIVCVGTDRSTGDALGPLVGTKLSRYRSPHFDLYGTLEHPVHAMNLAETLHKIERKTPRPFIIGVDACLGQAASVGCIQLGEGPVRPGAGVNKELPPVGDIHMTGIVNVGGFMEYFVLQNTRLHLVMRMADLIAQSLISAVHAVRRQRPLAAVQPAQSPAVPRA